MPCLAGFTRPTYGSGQPYRAGISSNQRVGGQQDDALDHRLGDENPVERVLVNRRQGVDRNAVFAGDRQFVVAVIEQAPAQYPCVDLEIVSAEAALDGDFPQAQRR